MMLAPEFSRAQTARISDFTSSSSERGVFWMKPRRTKTASEHQGEDQGDPVDSGLDLATIASSSRSSAATRSPPVHSAKRVPSSLNPPSREHRLVRGNLIAQFAANNGKSLADACEIISVRPGVGADQEEQLRGEFVGERNVDVQEQAVPRRLVDGVDLNCVSIYVDGVR